MVSAKAGVIKVKLLLFLRELFELGKAGKKIFIILVALTIIGVLATLPGPFLFTWILTKAQTDLSANDLVIFVAFIVLLQFIQAGLGFIRVRMNRRFALDAANRLRDDFFAHLLQMPYSYFITHNAGGQANSYLNDIDDIDLAITEFIDVGLRALLSILFYGMAIVIWNPIIGILALVIFPVTIVAQRKIRFKVAKSSRNKVDLRQKIVSQVSEAVNTIQVVKSFTLEDRIEMQTAELSHDFMVNDVSMETYQSVLRSSASVLLIFVQYSFFVIGAIMVIRADLSVAEFLGQMLLLGRFIGPLHSFLEYINTLNKSESALHNVRKTLELKTEDSESNRELSTLPYNDSGASLDIKGLRFRYREDIPLIEGWDITIKPGQTVAIVGASGCGKTTLFHLLLGLFDNYQGDIIFNGQDIRKTKFSAIREQIGVVFQEHILFNDTIRHNLLIGLSEEEYDTIGDEKLWEALDMAHGREFVEQLEEGLDTYVGENGVKLSGGQRQRLALARVILKNPPLLLLDEATSALDSFSEVYIQKALDELFQNRTSLVIAHRLSTITSADIILVVDKGLIVQQGTHEELISIDGIYRRLYDAQVKGFLDWDSAKADGRDGETLKEEL